MTTNTTPRQATELQRPVDDRIIAGVATGLGRRYSINPWWFRIGLIVLTLFGGFGLALYAVGWLLIPEEGADQAILARWLSDFDTSNTPMMIGVGLVAVAALVLATSLDVLSGNVLVAAILFVIGVLLYRGDLGGSNQPDDPDDGGGDVPEDTLEDTTTALALEEPGAGGGDPPEDLLPTLSQEPSPPPAAKPRSILGQLTIAATLVAVGGLALLDAAGILFPGFVHYVALALGVVGVGLAIGTFLGRARWLIAVGLLLVPVLALGSVVPRWSFTGETGDVYYSVDSIQEIDDQYELAAGSLVLDLTSFVAEPGEGRREVDVSIGAGEIEIFVPAGEPIRVNASVGVGVVDLFGDERVGLGVDASVDVASPPVLIINAETGFGAVTVRAIQVAEG